MKVKVYYLKKNLVFPFFEGTPLDPVPLRE